MPPVFSQDTAHPTTKATVAESMIVRGQHIRILTTVTEVEAFREFWLSCNPGRDADFDFYLFFVQTNPDTIRPHVVVLYKGDTPTALLVGRIDFDRIPVRLGYFTLPTPKVKILQFIWGGLLGNISDVNAAVLVNSVTETLAVRQADVANFHYVDLSSTIARCARTQPGWLFCDHLIRPQTHRRRKLSNSDATFSTSLSSNEKYQQRKRERRLQQEFGEVRIELLQKPDDIDRLILEAECIARSSYQRGLRVGFSDSPLIRARIEFEARKGWLRAHILYLDGKPSAFWIASLRNNIFLSDYLAFDPVYAKYAPGMYLIFKVLEGLWDGSDAKTVDYVDFGGGDAAYKERLSNHSHQEASIYIFGPTLKALYAQSLRSSVGLINISARYFLGRARLLDPVKRIWRGRSLKKQ